MAQSGRADRGTCTGIIRHGRPCTLCVERLGHRIGDHCPDGLCADLALVGVQEASRCHPRIDGRK